MSNILTPTEEALLALWLVPARLMAEGMKKQWREKRMRDRENLGMPPWEAREEE